MDDSVENGSNEETTEQSRSAACHAEMVKFYRDTLDFVMETVEAGNIEVANIVLRNLVERGDALRSDGMMR